jgi:hypothetical protein
VSRSSSRLEINEHPVFPRHSLYSLKPELPVSGSLSLLRPPITVCQSTGILACFPSTTRFRLALGADSPCVDYRCAGILGLSACGVFTRIIVTHVSIRTSDTSSTLLNAPSSAYRTLLYHAINLLRLIAFTASVLGFSPVHSSAQTDSTSELLRFL